MFSAKQRYIIARMHEWDITSKPSVDLLIEFFDKNPNIEIKNIRREFSLFVKEKRYKYQMSIEDKLQYDQHNKTEKEKERRHKVIIFNEQLHF